MKRKYYMIDTININGTPTLRLRGTTICTTSRVQFMANALGCQLMRHLPKELKDRISAETLNQ